MSKQAVAAAPKAVRVRAFVYCSTDSFERLADIGSKWMRCPAAHQSNILDEAESCQSDEHRRPAAEYMKHRTCWDVASQVDADRLRRLIAVWPNLTRSTQVSLVAQFKAVCHAN